MRFKTLMMAACTCLFATSVVYAADDSLSAQNPTASTTTPSTENVGSLNPASNAEAQTGAPGMDLSANNTASPLQALENGSSNDDISADTATGDDDY